MVWATRELRVHRVRYRVSLLATVSFVSPEAQVCLHGLSAGCGARAPLLCAPQAHKKHVIMTVYGHHVSVRVTGKRHLLSGAGLVWQLGMVHAPEAAHRGGA